MRILRSVMLLSVFAVAGCAARKAPEPQFTAQPSAGVPGAPATAFATNQAPIVTAETALAGRVALVNPTARFVVLNFPVGTMAPVEQRLILYRQGSKVGEVKVTGPQRGVNIVADLVAGGAEVGDEARSQ